MFNARHEAISLCCRSLATNNSGEEFAKAKPTLHHSSLLRDHTYKPCSRSRAVFRLKQGSRKV